MNLKLGDELQFDIAGETRTARISSVREVKWDSFQPNFFLMFAPGLLDGSQGTWMTAAHLRPRNPKTIADLVRRFPSVSVFNVDDLLRQVRSVIDKAAGGRAERLPVHADRGPRGADRGGAGESRRTPLRKRHAAHARRESLHGAQGPAGGVRGARRAVGHARRRGCVDRRRVSSPRACCRSRTRRIRGYGSTVWWAAVCWSASRAGWPRARW